MLTRQEALALAARAVADGLRGAGMTKRGRVSWRRTAEQALGGVTLDERWLADGVLGVEVTAYAAPLALFELGDEGVVGRDFNALTIAWSMRQQDAGAPDFFELALRGVDERVLAAIESYVRDQALPALDKLLVPGALHAHIRAVASGSTLVNPPQLIQAVAVLVSEGDAALVPPLVRRFRDLSVAALNAEDAAMWTFPPGLLDDLLSMQAHHPEFDALAAVRPFLRDDNEPDSSASHRGGGGGLVQSKAAFAEDLWLYGEDELALAMWQADDQTHRYVMRAAASPGALVDDMRASVSLREMAALGAVEVLTGQARALRRKRRRPERTLESLWQTLGVARPGEADDTPAATEVP